MEYATSNMKSSKQKWQFHLLRESLVKTHTFLSWVEPRKLFPFFEFGRCSEKFESNGTWKKYQSKNVRKQTFHDKLFVTFCICNVCVMEALARNTLNSIKCISMECIITFFQSKQQQRILFISFSIYIWISKWIHVWTIFHDFVV